MPSQSTNVHPIAGLPVTTTRPRFGRGWLVARLSLGFLTFINVQYMIALACENATGLVLRLSEIFCTAAVNWSLNSLPLIEPGTASLTSPFSQSAGASRYVRSARLVVV